MELHAGQCWTYRTPDGYESSRLIIGAIVTFEHDRSIVCCAATDAPRRYKDGHIDPVLIPFLPMTEEAFRASVTGFEGMAELPTPFAEKLEEWSRDPRGLSTFTVAFEGFLDRMIAMQMAEIAGLSAA
ncbi:MAG: hypothetical protein WC807_01240 [Hyphomicrobium sp.]|jgi:hypothetical protein